MKLIPQTLFILCGEAFSGKSTLSKKISESYGAHIIGRDSIYFALENMLALKNTPEHEDDELWDNLWPLSMQGVKNHLALGNSVVIDDNCLYLKQRTELRTIAKEKGVKSLLIFLNIRTEILRHRKEENKILKLRHSVPSEWIEEDSRAFERPTAAENPIAYTHDTDLNEWLNHLEIQVKANYISKSS